MNTGHWEVDVEFDPTQYFGFIYRITNILTGMMYIGKKQLVSISMKTLKGKKRRTKVISESNWRTYTGSSKWLNEDIEKYGMENFRFEILSLHKSKGGLHYAEVERHVKEDVLRRRFDDGRRMFYNGNISAVKFIPSEDAPVMIKPIME